MQIASFRIVFAIVGLVLSGCVTSPDVIKTEQPPTATKLMPGDDAGGEWMRERGPASGLNISYEAEIERLCNPPQPFALVTGAAATILGIVIPIAVDWVLGEVEAALKRELELYTKTYTATWYGKPPKSLTANSGSGRPGCIRISRFGSGKDGLAELDFIARLAPTSDRDALEIQPLRLYVGKGYAKGSDLTVAIGLKADAVWADRNVGRSGTIFNEVLLTRKFSPASPVWYHPMVKGGNRNDGDWVNAKIVPLLARSIAVDGSVQLAAAPVTLTATIAENGLPPEWLKKLVALLDAKKGDISKAASDAAVKRLTEEPKP